MKVQSSQFYSGTATTKTQGKMEIYLNNEILDFDTSEEEENKGIQLGYNYNSEIIAGADCVTSSQCSNYDADNSELSGKSQLNGVDYNYKELFTTNIDSAPLYARYTFLCGSNKRDTSSNVGTSDISKCFFNGVYDYSSDYLTQIIAMRKIKLK